MANRTYTFIDLFAGCGGLSEGFLATGRYEALAHIEWEKPMVDTLRNRLVQRWGHTIEEAQQRVIQFDIQKTEELVEGNWSEESIRDFGQFNHPSVEVVINKQSIYYSMSILGVKSVIAGFHIHLD